MKVQLVKDKVTYIFTWLTLPYFTRERLRKRGNECSRQAIEVVLKGPNSRKLVIDCMKGKVNISISDIHLALIRKKKVISVKKIRDLASNEYLSSIIIHDIIMHYYDVYEQRLKKIIACAEAGYFDKSQQLNVVHESRMLVKEGDANGVANLIDSAITTACLKKKPPSPS